MSTVRDLAAGLKANLDPIDGIQVSQIPRSNPKPPIIHMWPSSIPSYHRAMQVGLVEVVFTVQLVLPYIDDTQAFRAYDFLDETGALSVRQAIESDKTLGGACDRLQCESSGGLTADVTIDNQLRLTADWTVRIYL